MTEKAVSYGRVSTATQADEGFSLNAQDNLFDDYAIKNNLDLTLKFATAESAKKAGRRDFNEMIVYIKKNRIKHVLFEKVDRMTRNFYDLVAIYDLMEKHDINLHLIKNSLILNKNSRSQDKFQLDIHVVLARNFINNLSEETIKGMHESAKQGNNIHQVPQGYKKDPLTDEVIFSEDAYKIKRVFSEYLAGSTTTAITNITGIKRYAIYYILKNPFYAGRIKAFGNEYKGKHPAIVDDITFLLVQQKISSKRDNKTMKKRKFKFSGMIYCTCGNILIGEEKKRKYIYYSCSSRFSRKTKDSKCNNTKYLAEPIIEKQLIERFSTIKISEEKLKKIREQIDIFVANQNKEYTHERNAIQGELTKLEGMIKKSQDMLAKDQITPPEYREMTDRYKLDQVGLNNKLNNLVDHNIDIHRKAYEQLLAFINMDKILLIIDDISSYNDYVKTLTRNWLYDGSTLTYDWSETMESVIDLDECCEWRPRNESNVRPRP